MFKPSAIYMQGDSLDYRQKREDVQKVYELVMSKLVDLLIRTLCEKLNVFANDYNDFHDRPLCRGRKAKESLTVGIATVTNQQHLYVSLFLGQQFNHVSAGALLCELHIDHKSEELPWNDSLEANARFDILKSISTRKLNNTGFGGYVSDLSPSNLAHTRGRKNIDNSPTALLCHPLS